MILESANVLEICLETFSESTEIEDVRNKTRRQTYLLREFIAQGRTHV